MPYDATTTLIPRGLVAGDIPSMSLEKQARIGFFSEITNPKTAKLYEHSLDIYLAWCADQEIDVMTARPVQLRLYQTWLSHQPLAESTRSRMFGVVCTFYRRAVIDELILRDPTLGIKRPKVDKGKQRRTWLEPLEMKQYFNTSRDTSIQHYAMATLLGECALRAEEACSLQIQHMTRTAGRDTIRFIGKGNKAATVMLQPNVSEVVRAAIGDRRLGPVVLNTEGNAYNPNSLWRMVKVTADKAGLDPDEVSPHTLRRTCARTLHLLGVPLTQIQALLRHEDPKTTMLYVGSTGAAADIAAMQVSTFYASLGA